MFGLVAALYHALNHASFKGLLFLGAGAVLHATRTRDMNQLGGLIRGMPWTAPASWSGAAAIAGLPPLNGFVSEWLLFQALLGGAELPRRSSPLLMTLAVGVLALTGGLAAACFVKAFGITFLAIPRSARRRARPRGARSMRSAWGCSPSPAWRSGSGPAWSCRPWAASSPGSGGLPAGLAPGCPG